MKSQQPFFTPLYNFSCISSLILFTFSSLQSLSSQLTLIITTSFCWLDLNLTCTLFGLFFFISHQISQKNIYTKNTFTQKKPKISRQEGTQPQQTQDDTLYSCLTKRPVLSYSLPSYYKLISQKKMILPFRFCSSSFFFFGALFSADGWIDLTSAVTLLCWCCWWWSKRESSPKDTFKMHSSHIIYTKCTITSSSLLLFLHPFNKNTHTSRTKQSVYIVENF